jgi:hypothetical protein
MTVNAPITARLSPTSPPGIAATASQGKSRQKSWISQRRRPDTQRLRHMRVSFGGCTRIRLPRQAIPSLPPSHDGGASAASAALVGQPHRVPRRAWRRLDKAFELQDAPLDEDLPEELLAVPAVKFAAVGLTCLCSAMRYENGEAPRFDRLTQPHSAQEIMDRTGALPSDDLQSDCIGIF